MWCTTTNKWTCGKHCCGSRTTFLQLVCQRRPLALRQPLEAVSCQIYLRLLLSSSAQRPLTAGNRLLRWWFDLQTGSASTGFSFIRYFISSVDENHERAVRSSWRLKTWISSGVWIFTKTPATLLEHNIPRTSSNVFFFKPFICYLSLVLCLVTHLSVSFFWESNLWTICPHSISSIPAATTSPASPEDLWSFVILADGVCDLDPVWICQIPHIKSENSI